MRETYRVIRSVVWWWHTEGDLPRHAPISVLRVEYLEPERSSGASGPPVRYGATRVESGKRYQSRDSQSIAGDLWGHTLPGGSSHTLLREISIVSEARDGDSLLVATKSKAL